MNKCVEGDLLKRVIILVVDTKKFDPALRELKIWTRSVC